MATAVLVASFLTSSSGVWDSPGRARTGERLTSATVPLNKDRTFGTDGYTVSLMSLTDNGLGVAVEPDGGIIVVGSGRSGSDPPFETFVARYTDAGRLDPNFGTNGVVVASSSSPVLELRAVAV